VTAPLGRRFLAFLIDGIIAFALLQLSFRAFGENFFRVNADTPDALLALNLAIAALYGIAPVVLWGGTPGKLAMGLYISDSSGNGVSVWRATLRHVAFSNFFVTTLFTPSFDFALYFDGLLWIVSLIMMFTDAAQRRALHDRIAGTRVLRGKATPRDTQPSLEAI
jgi:uncharacterized RDD family membrane protein YckC